MDSVSRQSSLTTRIKAFSDLQEVAQSNHWQDHWSKHLACCVVRSHRGVKLCAEYARLVRPRFKSAAEQPNRTPLHLRFSPPSSARLMGNHVRHAHPPCSVWGRTKSQDARVGQALLGDGEDHAISFSFQLQCSPRRWQASQFRNAAVDTSVLFKLIVSSSSSPTSSSTSLIPKPRRMRRN